MKYKEAYCKKLRTNMGVQEISNIFYNDPKKFERELRGAMFCPECGQAKMEFVNGPPGFLRGYPNSLHEDGCEMELEEMNAEEVSQLNTTTGRKTIERQMERILRAQFLFLQRDNLLNITEEKTGTNRSERQTTYGKRAPYKTIPKRSFEAITSEDCKKSKIFYGQVRIMWESGEEFEKILLYSVITDRMICRLSVNKTAWKYLKNVLDGHLGKNEIVAFYGKLYSGPVDKSKNWYRGWLGDSRNFKIF